MTYDPRLPPPKSDAEARARFAETWSAAERLIAARKELLGFRKRWDGLKELKGQYA